MEFTEKLLIPFIILRNHNLFNPIEQGIQYSINIQYIKKKISQMLQQGQELSVVSGLHSLHEHPHLAAAGYLNEYLII